MVSALLTDLDREAIAPPTALSISDWSEAHRVIVAKDAARPGKWRNDLTPYLVEPMDACDSVDVDIVVFQAAARVGKSELGNNAMGGWVDQDPGPALLVYPTEPAAKERCNNELRPLFQRVPRLRRHLGRGRWDLTKGELDLVPCRIYIAWSGSPQALASRTIRRVHLDEVNKFPRFTGNDASPIALAIRRTETYRHRRTILITSTPTTRAGAITQELERCVDRRYYEVPCPCCGEFQRLDFFDGMRWPGRRGEDGDYLPGCELDEDIGARELSNLIQVEQSAWYECAACGERLEDRRDKARMTRAGRWVSDGYPPGEHPRSRRRGYQISALYSQLGSSWSDIAAQWVLAEGSPELEMELYTQVLGIPYDNQRSMVSLAALEARASARHARRRVPDWASSLILTADTQADHWYYVVRAWSPDFSRSRQIDRGVVKSLAQLEQIESRVWPGPDGRGFTVGTVGIDSGGAVDTIDGTNTTEIVYAWCRKKPKRRLPVKGWGGSTRPSKAITVREADYRRAGRKHWGVRLHLIDTHLYQDRLAGLVSGPADRWEVAHIDREYLDHMTGKQRMQVMSKGGKLETRWAPVAAGRRHDYWDLEVYQLAMADVARGVGRRSTETVQGNRRGVEWFADRKRRRAAAR